MYRPENSTDCARLGYAMIGFSYNINDEYDPNNGKPRCHDILSDFLGIIEDEGAPASSLTGGLV